MKGFFASSTVQQVQPGAGLVPRCGACGLYRTCNSPKMLPYGKGRKQVLVVGEAPGQTEDEEGRPFIGKAGQFLRQVLSSFDVNLDQDAITTNACICRPPGNKTPDPLQVAYCRPNLLNTIKANEPRVIVTLGSRALLSALGPYWKGDIGPLEAWVGWQIPLDGFWLCPTYHPSFLLRSRNELMDRLFAQHLESAFAIDRTPPARPNLADRVRVIYDAAEAADALLDIEQDGGWAAIDYETNCLKPELPKAKIFSCAVSNGRKTISYPWAGEAIEATRKFCRNPHLTKIAANLKFEDRWTREHLQTEVSNWGWDTMVAAHCLDNRPGITSLKFQAFVLLGIPSYNENIVPYLKSHKGHYNRITEIAPADLLLYGGMDAILEFYLARKQRKLMGYES